MAVTATMSNHAKKQAMSGDVDYDSHTFKIILMNNTFAFDKDSDATLANVSGEELSTGNGYTQQTKALESGELTEDDSNDRGHMTWSDVTWTASGGTIGPTGAAIIYDDTSSDDTVIGCIDFGTDYSVTDGSSLEIGSIVVNLM